MAPYLDDQAVVQTIVYDQKFRPVKASTQRFFRDLLAIAIRAKHRCCFHDFCDTPVDECELDHKHPASKGGPTSDENGQPGCTPHNRHKSDSTEWVLRTIDVDPEGAIDGFPAGGTVGADGGWVAADC